MFCGGPGLNWLLGVCLASMCGKEKSRNPPVPCGGMDSG